MGKGVKKSEKNVLTSFMDGPLHQFDPTINDSKGC